ncbi:uncharacterized protein PRCAT00006360001 [Priceomyces carsonii]|uniref:uncharacterized protein n=1 Tax=Priceomyces carsonii TaxID=28549 RepID=UPI002EDB59C2|nr:unnamed protein product [Priceomyces carsonii]
MLEKHFLHIVETYKHHPLFSSSALLGAILFYYLVAVPFFLSPLRKIPGPYWNRVSKWPSLNGQRTNEWIGKVNSLHHKYGDVVVLSPSEISVNGSPDMINDIYVKNFSKGCFYENFRNHGNRVNPFSELNNECHLKYKKILMTMYLKTAIFSTLNPTRKHLVKIAGKLVKRVRTDMSASKANNEGAVEVFSLFSCLAMDVILAFELGPSCGTDLIENLEEREIVKLYRVRDSVAFWTTFFPRIFRFIATNDVKNAFKKIESWHFSLYSKAEEKSESPSIRALNGKGFFGKDAYSFITDNIFAGHRTTATQLTYFCYELSRPVNNVWHRRLKEELYGHFGVPKSEDSVIDDLEAIDKLIVLDALLQENLRVHSSIPGAEPRVVDRSYEVEIPDCDTMKRILVPKGTVISCLPFSMHRQESVFPSPGKFSPERWLKSQNESEEEFKSRVSGQQRFMMPFGKGIRLCLGKNLALIEIKIALANLYWHFSSMISDQWCYVESRKPSDILMGLKNRGLNKTDEEKMVMVDSYTTHPLNGECWLSWLS